MVELCLQRFKLSISVDIQNNADLLGDIMERSNQISSIQYALAHKENETNMLKETTLNGDDDKATSNTYSVPSYGSIV